MNNLSHKRPKRSASGRYRLLIAGLLSFACVSSATQSMSGKSADSAKGLPVKNQRLLAMNTQENKSTSFAMSLFNELAKDETENVLISPFSAYAALSMTLNGADGATKEQMARTLGVTADAIDALNARNQKVFAALNANQKVQLEVANAVYSDKSTPFNPEFIELCKKVYSAEAQSANFSDESTVKAINDWCSKKTHGKITEILKKLSPSEKMVLLNAIYFKGSWEKQFDKTRTSDDKFTTGTGQKLPIRMMHQNGKLFYFADSEIESLMLPYAGGKQNMFLFLPPEGMKISEVRKRFTEANWKQWMQSYRPREVNLSLPRFTIKFSGKLNDALKAIGMPDAFSESKANFKKMIAAPIWISQVLQKTYMDVNEEGTEAAAVTAVVMITKSAMSRPESVVEFRVDRPFVLALADSESGEILFLGSIVKP